MTIISFTNSVKSIRWKNEADGFWSMGCNFEGDNYKNVLSRADDCSGECRIDQQCTHYTWTNYHGGTCWMRSNDQISKYDAIESNDNGGYIRCGIVSTKIQWKLGPYGPWAMGCDFNSDNDLSIEYSSREECPTLCKTTNGCTHFVWMKENGGTCNLLTGGASKGDALLDGYQVMCGIIEEISFYKKLLKESKFNLIDYNEL